MLPAPLSAVAKGRIGPPPMGISSSSIPPPPNSPARAVGATLQDLPKLVDDAEKLVGQALESGYAVSLDVLGDIQLPPGAHVQVDKAQLRALAALYLAAALEPAGVITSAEALASLMASGTIQLDLGESVPLIREFWGSRFERIDARERGAFFGRLFGPSYGGGSADMASNEEFDSLMLEVCEALYRLDEYRDNPPHGSTAQQARIRAAAQNLLGNLVDTGGGVTPFLAEDILGTLKHAIGILSHPDVRRAFMARDIWGVITGVNNMAGRGSPNHRTLVRRGQAGMLVIAWLAESAPQLAAQGRSLIRLDHPVIPSALDWIQATLLISESATPPVSPVTGPQAGENSQWAEIGF